MHVVVPFSKVIRWPQSWLAYSQLVRLKCWKDGDSGLMEGTPGRTKCQVRLTEISVTTRTNGGNDSVGTTRTNGGNDSVVMTRTNGGNDSVITVDDGFNPKA